MSKYNGYARKLDTAFKTAREAYLTAYKRLGEAKANYKDKAEYRAGEQTYYWKARKAEAEMELAKAEASFDKAKNESWESFKREAQALKNALAKEIMGDGLADPEALDTNAVELLKAGILNVDDIESFVERYDNNPTMLKLISKYAGDMAKNTENVQDRRRLLAVERATATGLSLKVQEFNNLVADSMIYAGLTRDNNSNDFIAVMCGKWETSAHKVENF